MIRNTLNPYDPRILALTFGALLLVCYAFARAFERPLATWEGEANG